MSLDVYAGWDFARIGSFSLQFTDSGGSSTITISTGTYCHRDLTSVLGSGLYDDFDAALQTALNADATLAQTYTVVWDNTALTYTIAATGNFSTADPAGTVAGQILGIDAAVSSTASKESDVRPYYVIRANVGGKMRSSDDYEPAGVAEDDYTMAGDTFGFADVNDDGTAITFQDFTLPHEAQAHVWRRYADTASPWSANGPAWTYQHLWEHARVSEPLLVVDSVDSVVGFLRAEGAHWAPERVTADWDGYWHVPVKMYVRGRL